MNTRKFAVILSVLFLLTPSLRADEPTGLIAEGTPWETPYFVKTSTVEGPTVLVIGGIHGDQPAGCLAAGQIRHWPLSKGKLIVIPAANLRGLNENRRTIPGVAESERDLNRNFVIADNGDVEPKGKLASSIWELVAEEKPDWLIDFHEGIKFHISHQPLPGRKRSAGSTIIYRKSTELAPIAERALAAVNATVEDPAKKFVILTSGSVRGGVARTAAVKLGAKYIVPLTTSGGQALSYRAQQLRIIANSIFNDIGISDRDCTDLVTGGAGQESAIAKAVHRSSGKPSPKAGNSTSTSTSTSEVEIKEVSEVIRKFFPADAKGGIGVLITRDNQILHCKGYGKKNGKDPVTPDTPMGLASITKQFAAMCAAMLIEEGKLKMTDKVSDFLPDLEFQNPGRELLVQDLIWHINGLPNFIKKAERESIAAYKKEHGLKNLNNQTHAEWLATLPLLRPPGLEHDYTNSGYVLMCRILEIIIERPFHEFQQERIFDLLDMNDTTDSNRFNGSGNMSTTLLDYAKWDRALWNESLLNEETSKLYFTSGKLDNGKPAGYAMGWRVEYDENDELIRATHGGSGSAPGNVRNMVSRNFQSRTTVAFFARENTSLTRARRTEFIEALEACVVNHLD